MTNKVSVRFDDGRIATLDVTPEDMAALITSFRYRTGVDLLAGTVDAASAWAAYKARQHSWIGQPRTKRRVGAA